MASRLAELETGDEDDEVGYRLDDWADRERGRLIESLNRDEIPHRFEDDELVVTAEDESRVDDLMAELAANLEPDDVALLADGEVRWDQAATEVRAGGEVDEQVGSALRLLGDGAHRLRQDPTDMQADGDVAEASATVFMVDGYSGADDATWAAIGRVTRRLLSALGADEALEDEIRSEAAVLDKLVEPLVSPATGAPALTAAAPAPADAGSDNGEPDAGSD